MRYRASEKFEIIRLVKGSPLPVKRALEQLAPPSIAGMICIDSSERRAWKIVSRFDRLWDREDLFHHQPSWQSTR
jgi:hypothetical protein